MFNLDGFVKSPSAALRCFLRRCGVPVSTPYSSGFARLASGAFYIAIQILTFYESINLNHLKINFASIFPLKRSTMRQFRGCILDFLGGNMIRMTEVRYILKWRCFNC
jgi:hypothetical protein